MLQLFYIFDNWLYLHLNSLLNMNQGVLPPPHFFAKIENKLNKKT